MLKNHVSIRLKFSSLNVFAKHAHKKHAHNKHAEILEADTRLRAEFLKRQTQGLHRQKPSFRKFYDPKSRNVYRKIEDNEEQYEDDEENDSMWSLNDREMYVWRSSDNCQVGEKHERTNFLSNSKALMFLSRDSQPLFNMAEKHVKYSGCRSAHKMSIYLQIIQLSVKSLS